jgi:hypothetical protein
MPMLSMSALNVYAGISTGEPVTNKEMRKPPIIITQDGVLLLRISAGVPILHFYTFTLGMLVPERNKLPLQNENPR